MTKKISGLLLALCLLIHYGTAKAADTEDGGLDKYQFAQLEASKTGRTFLVVGKVYEVLRDGIIITGLFSEKPELDLNKQICAIIIKEDELFKEVELLNKKSLDPVTNAVQSKKFDDKMKLLKQLLDEKDELNKELLRVRKASINLAATRYFRVTCDSSKYADDDVVEALVLEKEGNISYTDKYGTTKTIHKGRIVPVSGGK